MNMIVNIRTIDPASPGFPKQLHLQALEHAVDDRVDFRSSAASIPVPCVPLSDMQMSDYQDLMAKADALVIAGRQQDASRLKQLAVNILRTGAPSLE